MIFGTDQPAVCRYLQSADPVSGVMDGLVPYSGTTHGGSTHDPRRSGAMTRTWDASQNP